MPRPPLAKVEHLERIFEVILQADIRAGRAGEHVIDPGADHAENQRDEQRIPDVIGIDVVPLGFAGGNECARQSAGDDQNAVPVDRERRSIGQRDRKCHGRGKEIHRNSFDKEVGAHYTTSCPE